MRRQLRRRLAVVMTLLLTALTGCHPTQPFYLQEDGDLSHYLDYATEIEHPDVYQPVLDEVQFARAPLTLSDPRFDEFWELSLEEAIHIALQNSKVIRTLSGVTPQTFADALVGRVASSTTVYDPAIVESDPVNGVEGALSAFDAQFELLGTGANGSVYSTTDRVNNATTVNAFNNTDRGGLVGSITKRTATGATVRAASTTERIGGNPFFAQTHNSFWEQSFQLQVTQPLLGPDPRSISSIGGGTLVNRIPVILARINTDVTIAGFEANVRNLVMDLENAYWDLYCAYRNLESARVGRDAAQSTWAGVNARRSEGQEGVQSEAQAREQFFFFRAQLETALRDLHNAEANLRYLMGIAATDGRLIRPSDEPTTAEIAFDWNQIQAESLVRSPELRQQKWTIKRRELEIQLAKHRLLPQLDVGAQYLWYGAGDDLINADRSGLNFPEDSSTAFDVLTEGNFQEAAFFFNFRLPIGYRQALAGVRNAQLQLARDSARLEDMELNTSHLLSTSVRTLDFNYRSAQTHFNRWKAAQAEVESAEALFEAGAQNATIDIVLDAQRRRSQAQIDYFRALCEYNKSLAFVHYRKGSLLDYDNIMLAEGPWPQKAYWDALEKARERDASYYFDYGWTRPGVVSQGPGYEVVGEGTLYDEVIDGDFEGEAVPTPEPLELDELPGSDVPGSDAPADEAPGPITTRPDGPSLNAPRRAAVDVDDNHVATQSVERFDYGDLGLGDALGSDGSSVQQASFDEE